MWFRRSAVEWILVRVWKEREIREQKAGALPDREDSDRETIFLSSFSLSEHVRAALFKLWEHYILF